MTILSEILLGLGLGYIFGAIPVGYFVGRAYGVDVRQYGSGRTGGSNVLRTIGWVAFTLTILGDALKGFLPIFLLTRVLAPNVPTAAASGVVGVLVGNNWSIIIAWLARASTNLAPLSTPYAFLKSIFAKAKGGVGVITTAAAALTLFWPPIIPLTIAGLAILLLIKYSSLASMTVAALYPLVMAYYVIIGAAPIVYLPMSIIVAAIVISALMPNMRRLLDGTEQKFGQRVSTK